METDVCVVGGGPAGLVLALLLARRGVHTVVLEKHDDFLRDFRGDTVHPSTLTLMDEMGLGEHLDGLPHRKISTLSLTFAESGRTYRIADLSRLRVPHPYIALLPQWHLLDLLAGAAAESPAFTLLRSTPAVDVMRDGSGAVTGVRAAGPDGPIEIRARLTVAADGRHSTIRQRLGVRPKEFGAPMDVLWFRLPRSPADGAGVQGRIGTGQIMVCIDRGDYWQCARVIPKGGHERVVAAGITRFRESVAALAPPLADRVDTIGSFDDVKVLTVTVDRLNRWHAPGVLFIGDAAHAMSPIGGVGINLAVQDAVAAARLLAEPLLRGGPVDPAALAAVRRRRRFPTFGTQLLQRAMQRRILAPVLAGARVTKAPLPVRIIDRIPAIQAIPARIIGVGLRPEHVTGKLERSSTRRRIRTRRPKG